MAYKLYMMCHASSIRHLAAGLPPTLPLLNGRSGWARPAGICWRHVKTSSVLEPVGGLCPEAAIHLANRHSMHVFSSSHLMWVHANQPNTRTDKNVGTNGFVTSFPEATSALELPPLDEHVQMV